MANLAAKDPAYSGPDVATRWKPGHSVGRPQTKWLRAKLDEVDEKTGKPKREIIAEHLLELATSYTVMHLGRDLELASGRDSVDAAKILFAYCYGKPPPSVEEQSLHLAEHFRAIARDQFDILVKMLGDRLKTMSVDEMAELLAKCDRNPRRFIEAAKAEMGGAFDEPQQIEASPPEPAAPGDPAPAGQAESPDPEAARPAGEDGDE